MFAFTLADGVEGFSVFDVSRALRERGWQVPAYPFPDNRTDLAALRVVVRNGFGHDMAHLFLADLKRQLPRLEKQGQPIHDSASGAGFHHESTQRAPVAVGPSRDSLVGEHHATARALGSLAQYSQITAKRA